MTCPQPDPREPAQLLAELDDGSRVIIGTYYPDMLDLCAEDFLGLTVDEAVDTCIDAGLMLTKSPVTL